MSAFRTYFEKALLRIGDLDEIVRIAREEAERCGLSAMDALHVAAAHIGGAQFLVTLENESKPMYRTSLVRVVHLSKLATVPRAPAPGSPGEALKTTSWLGILLG